MREALIREIQDLRLLVRSPRDPEGRVFAQLGDALRRSGEMDEALLVLREGVRQHPRFTPGFVALGWAAQDAGELNEALEGYRQALELDPDNPFGLFGVGTILKARGDSTGVQLITQAVDLHPDIRNLAPLTVVSPGSLDEVAFMRLGDLESNASRDEVDLPFMTLADLAPDTFPAGPLETGEADRAPFMSLADLAPDALQAGSPDMEEVGHLPFMSLADLAPDALQAGASVMDELGHLPFMSLAELAPDPKPTGMTGLGDGSVLPFMTLAELAPEGSDAVDLPFVPLDALAPSPTRRPNAPGPHPEDGREPYEEDGDVVDATPLTRTMAELFVRQGLLDRAVHVYEQLLVKSPDDAALAERLRDLQDRPALGSDAEAARTSPSSRMGDEDHPALSIPEPESDAPSPYAWNVEGEEPDAASRPENSAGAYFGRLLNWNPGNAAGKVDATADSGTQPDEPGDEK